MLNPDSSLPTPITVFSVSVTFRVLRLEFFSICNSVQSCPSFNNFCTSCQVMDIYALGSSLVRCRIYKVRCYWIWFSVVCWICPFSVLVLFTGLMSMLPVCVLLYFSCTYFAWSFLSFLSSRVFFSHYIVSGFLVPNCGQKLSDV